jgi:DHA2 family multidrug resistance protein
MAVMLASVLQALDTTIANVALPHIRGSLSATSEQMGWVLTSYIVCAAIMTPLSGWLSTAYGRKKVLVASIAGFTITSALCGMAQSVAWGGRLLHDGAGGAPRRPRRCPRAHRLRPPRHGFVPLDDVRHVTPDG